jgi:hypothetical protein
MKTAFKKFNMDINSGNNTLKRLLSPNQFLLSKIIMAFYDCNTSIVSESFNDLSHNKSLSRSLFDFTSPEYQEVLDSYPVKDQLPKDFIKKKEDKKSISFQNNRNQDKTKKEDKKSISFQNNSKLTKDQKREFSTNSFNLG